jgi:hypothetical protein
MPTALRAYVRFSAQGEEVTFKFALRMYKFDAAARQETSTFTIQDYGIAKCSELDNTSYTVLSPAVTVKAP